MVVTPSNERAISWRHPFAKINAALSHKLAIRPSAKPGAMFTELWWSRFLSTFVMAIVFAKVIVALWGLIVMGSFRDYAWDVTQRIGLLFSESSESRAVPDKPIVFIDVDDRTWHDSRWGGGEPYPAPRRQIAALLRSAWDAAPSYIILDVLLDEPGLAPVTRYSEPPADPPKTTQLVPDASLRCVGAGPAQAHPTAPADAEVRGKEADKSGTDGQKDDEAALVSLLAAMERCRTKPLQPLVLIARSFRSPERLGRRPSCTIPARRGSHERETKPSLELRSSLVDRAADWDGGGVLRSVAPYFRPSRDAKIRSWLLDETVCAGATPARILSPERLVGRGGRSPDALSDPRLKPPEDGHHKSEKEMEAASLVDYAFADNAVPSEVNQHQMPIARLSAIEALNGLPKTVSIGERAVPTKGGIIIIGQSVPEAGDRHATPVGNMAGSLIIANSIISFGKHGRIKEFGHLEENLWQLGEALLCGLIFAVGKHWLRNLNRYASPIILGAVAIIISVYALRHGYYFDLWAPFLGALVHNVWDDLRDYWKERGHEDHALA